MKSQGSDSQITMPSLQLADGIFLVYDVTNRVSPFPGGVRRGRGGEGGGSRRERWVRRKGGVPIM